MEWSSLFEKLFRKLVPENRLGVFWRSVASHHRKHVKLDEHKVRYIVRARERGESCGDIALHLSVSRRRVEQLYALHKDNGEVPSLKRGGRRSLPISAEERRMVLAAYGRYMVNAVYSKGMKWAR